MLAGLAPAAPGSWTASAPAVRVAGPDRDYLSRPLTPPPLAAGATPTQVSWRYRLPIGPAPRAWLCQGRHCLALDQPRGRAPVPADWRGDRPLRFRFRLAEGARQPLRVRDLRLTLAYQARAGMDRSDK
nr:flagellar protein FlhE [Alloalcanivorax marinus]